MTYILAVLCIAVMILSLILIFMQMPGTWIIIGLTALWAFFAAPGHFGRQYIACIVALGVVGEVLEFCAGYFGGKKFGGTSQGGYGSIVGAVVGAILGAPVAFGLGALPGALAGAFAGSFLVEKRRGMETAGAFRAAFGATLGRFGGFVAKLGIGIAVIWMSIPRIWESI